MTDDSAPDNESAARLRIAGILLDLLSAADADAADHYPANWAAPFAAELLQAGAVTTSITGEADELQVTIGITQLMAATAGVMDVMLRSIADDRGLDRLTVLSTIRESIQDLF